MTGASLVLIALLGQAPSPSPSALVARLGANRYADREAAARELERLGRDALPALRAAHNHKDAEIRTRATALADKIAGGLLTEPTLITLNLRDRTLADAAREIGKQAGVKLALIPENLPQWRTTRVRLESPAPVPFWKAIDRLCDAGHLQFNNFVGNFPASKEPTLPLFGGGPRASGPVSDDGPFRVSIVSLHHQRDVLFQSGGRFFGGNPVGAFPPPPPVPVPAGRNPRPINTPVNDRFLVQMEVIGEPRLSLASHGSLRITEATDERNQSLLPPGQSQPAGVFESATIGHAMPASSVLHLHAPLAHPARLGGTITTLKGTIPVTVSARKPQPLVVPLAGATGKTFKNSDVSLSIQELKVNPLNHLTSIELSVRLLNPQDDGVPPQGPRNASPVFPRLGLNPQQVEIVDAQDRVINWQQSAWDAESSRFTITLTPSDPSMTPAQLRYYGLARAFTEIDFEFHDIPMP